jgi:hypothetical protein
VRFERFSALEIASRGSRNVNELIKLISQDDMKMELKDIPLSFLNLFGPDGSLIRRGSLLNEIQGGESENNALILKGKNNTLFH